MRTCAKCGAAENPLGRLRFKKSQIDKKVYCEKCDPQGVTGAVETETAPLVLPSAQSSAGLVVIQCPKCRSIPRGMHPAPCETCSDYGSVRIPVNYLNVYRPGSRKPEILTED